MRVAVSLNADGVDESSSTTLVYPGGKLATLVANGAVRMESAAIVAGTKGSVTVSLRKIVTLGYEIGILN